MKVTQVIPEPVEPPPEYHISLDKKELETLCNVLYLFGEETEVKATGVIYNLKDSTLDSIVSMRMGLLRYDHSVFSEYIDRQDD